MSIMRLTVEPGSILEQVLRREKIMVVTGKDIEIDADAFSLNHEAEKRACLDQSDEEIRARAVARTIHKHELATAAQWGDPLTVFNTEMKASRANMLNATEEVKREIRGATEFFREYLRVLADGQNIKLFNRLWWMFVVIFFGDLLLLFIWIAIIGIRH